MTKPKVSDGSASRAIPEHTRTDLKKGAVTVRPTQAQLKYLSLGKTEPGGKLPLFDKNGQQIKAATIRSCIENGWAEHWFSNPIKPDWLVCRLTGDGLNIVKRHSSK